LEEGAKVAIRSYRDLEVYRRAKALVVPIHRLVEGFPAHERFDLCDQMRRASKSVVANIVEGYSDKDTPGKAKQLWRNAMGSANEIVEHLETAVALGYASQDTCRPYTEEYIITAKQLNKLIKNWRKL
jgi:four helix bundle protein